MNEIFNLWAKRVPSYNVEYKTLFDKLALKGNSDKDVELRKAKGLIFSSNYEFYIYAFFAGIYNNSSIQIKSGKEITDFGLPIEDWGKKSRNVGRKDFSIIQKFIFSIVVEKSDIDFLQLELEDSEDIIKKSISNLIGIMEGYANGGLKTIQEKLEKAPHYFYTDPYNTILLLQELIKK